MLETLIRIQCGAMGPARESCTRCMKHPQGIAQSKVTDDYNNDCYFSSPCQHQNRNPLLLRATEHSNENAKGKVKELIYLGREAA